MLNASQSLTDADYEAIAAAVMETARGRWFLAEYSRRNRHADTDMLLGALQRLEKIVADQTSLPPDGIRPALAEMARTLERTKAQMAAGRGETEGAHPEGGGYEFSSVVRDQEQATSDILAAAEQIQDIAWTMREHGIDPRHCEFLEARANEIYAACSLHDLATQRTRRMAAALRFLDGRIGTLLALWGFGAPPREGGDAANLSDEGGAPSCGDEGVVEADEAASPAPSPVRPSRQADRAQTPEADRLRSSPPSANGASQHGPLAALKALTPEETLALFS
ncbi:MAG TPA: hypothetical protein VFQ27_04510 [Xanthobacteraceae bacterium]|nr:hypothetical protein [Xanthobacteraceae bacterium]